MTPQDIDDLQLGIEWVKTSRMPDRVKAALSAVAHAEIDRLRAPIVLAAISPGHWTLSQADKVLALDFNPGRQTQLEAAMRFAACMLAPSGQRPQYVGAGWQGQELPSELFSRPVGPNALRNARNALADRVERAGWPEVGAEIRRMTVGRLGELDGFAPIGRVTVAHPCADGVQTFPQSAAPPIMGHRTNCPTP